MTSTLLIQQLVNLLTLWGVYALISVGLSLIFSVMRVINFAHAQLYMFGSYAVFVVYAQMQLPYPLALAAAAATAGVIGILIERFVVRPVQDDQLRSMVGTLGVLVGLGGIASLLFGEQDKYAPAVLDGTVDILGAAVPSQKVLILVSAAVIVTALFVYLRTTFQGRALRALAQDRTGARLQGVNVARIQMIGFAIGSALAGIAGGLILPIAVVNPTIGQPILLKMFIILLLGGLGSIEGAVVGALVLAAIETIGVTFFGQLSILGAYALVIALLLVRPQGLLASRGSA
jgi:branched-chain amino acid transport system permease protein